MKIVKELKRSFPETAMGLFRSPPLTLLKLQKVLLPQFHSSTVYNEPFLVEMQRRVRWVTCKYPSCLKSWAFAKLTAGTSLIFSSKSVLFEFFTYFRFLRILHMFNTNQDRNKESPLSFTSVIGGQGQ